MLNSCQVDIAVFCPVGGSQYRSDVRCRRLPDQSQEGGDTLRLTDRFQERWSL
jgi:hypothetical protein